MELLFTLFMPLLGAILLLFVNRGAGVLAKTFAFIISAISFLLSLTLYMNFDHTNPDFQFVTNIPWIGSIDAGFRIGIDGMGLLMVMLTTFITPIALMCSFDSIKKREKEYYIMVLLLQFAMTGVFISTDLFLFYIFWELILIPMYFIIGIWGGKGRLYATVKFFIFTVVGSLFMLVAIVWLGYYVGTDLLGNSAGFTTDFVKIRSALETAGMAYEVQKWIFWAFAISFLIKVPLFPLHTWLPDAHTEAPTPGSVILAGVLLKMGTYGLIRFNLDLFPEAAMANASIISFLAVVGIVYGAIVAMVQTDIKKLVAYTSVSHLGFVVLGIFSMTNEGIQGAIIQSVNHGLSTGMLFLLIGFIYERRHTREISDYGGIARVMPAYTVFFGIAMFSSIGLPILNGFVGEFLTLMGAFKSTVLNNHWYAIIGATGVIFAAIYLLWMFQRVFLGTITHEENKSLKDITKREWAMLVPLVIFIVWLGVYPSTFLKLSDISTDKLVKKIERVEMKTNDNLSDKNLIEYQSEEN
ncbi:NADH-quinone oxidoreductase subunit M [Candidatus Kapabacteria bacterium]|nr:NADH-quinone oxidoreductase subunit M [Candidatus Kapabacteria bacterium]